MEHEFVPGKRRCQSCGCTWKYRDDFPCNPEVRSDDEPQCGSQPWEEAVTEAPEPQVWHLNVWTTVNGVVFTGQHVYDGVDAVGWIANEGQCVVKNIIANSAGASF